MYNYSGVEHLLVFAVAMAEKGEGLSEGKQSSLQQEKGKETWARVIQDLLR